MKQGTIVLTPFPFTDLSTTKRRPAIVISKDNEQTGDVVVAYISSKISIQLTETDYLLESSDKDFKHTGLSKDSILKLNKLVTIDKRLITGELGIVSDEMLNEILKRLKGVFGI
ncbi:MAG: type II toxin-antitoxin system PemK/MazF family toxin [bacterium]|nr:type II toxin-antitoxin system PemK/MazF family toxin [bacterium]